MTVTVARTAMRARPAARTRLPRSPRSRSHPAQDPGSDEGDAQDDRAYLAGREADGGHAAAAGIAQPFALGTRVADHEGRDERGGGEPGAQVEAGLRAADDDADVDDTLTPAVEDAVHEGTQSTDRASGPGHGTVEHVEAGTERGHDARQQPPLQGRHEAAQRGDAEADERQHVGREACAGHGQGQRLHLGADAGALLR